MREEVVVASALVRNKEGRVLVLEGQGGVAALPGGLSERGETPEETAIREIFEETGLRIEIEKPVALYNLIVFNPDGTEKRRFLHYLFLASTMDADPRPSAEWQNSVAKCRWTTLKGLRGYRKVWPLPENVRTRISEGGLDLGNQGELEYKIE